MNILKNIELLCLLAIFMIILTMKSVGFVAALFGCCAITIVATIWLNYVTNDIDEDEF